MNYPKLKRKKVAITGHTSGIGKEVYDWCYTHGYDVRGYSRSTGYNLIEGTGLKTAQAILEWGPDIVFNNAWMPNAQINLLRTLHKKWKKQEKVIINTGSLAAYINTFEASQYEKEKRELSKYVLEASQEYPVNSKCRLHNVSFGYVDTRLVPQGGMIPAYEAAMILVNLIAPQPYLIPEILVSHLINSKEEVDKARETAANVMYEELRDSINLTKSITGNRWKV
jgi:NAD(P)-dependent dehydrogenase (short-subunit alcohol dehydrogenase family)